MVQEIIDNMPFESQIPICSPCKNGDHWYCVLNEDNGLRKSLGNNSTVIISSCSCGCKKMI